MVLRRYEGKSAFQTIAVELHNQKNPQKTHEISNRLYWGTCGCKNRR